MAVNLEVKGSLAKCLATENLIVEHKKVPTTMLPDPKPGIIYIWPSILVHYADGMKTNKLRMVTSWDMEVK